MLAFGYQLHLQDTCTHASTLGPQCAPAKTPQGPKQLISEATRRVFGSYMGAGLLHRSLRNPEYNTTAAMLNA